jgi:hypothetical protein
VRSPQGEATQTEAVRVLPPPTHVTEEWRGGQLSCNHKQNLQ